MRFRYLILCLALALPVAGQNPLVDGGNPDSDVEPFLNSILPHPYVMFGPSLMGGGYSPLAFREEVGINVEEHYWLIKASAAYDNGHKANDNDQPNPSGHDRYLLAGLYFRPGSGPFLNRWFFGGGYRWSQLSTTNYSKSGGRTFIGGGYDLALRSCPICRRYFSMRIGLDWVMAGTDWQNGSHGPEISFSLPGLRERRHWFWQQRVGVYRFHDTVTDPSSAYLTNLQTSKRAIDSFLDTGLVYRF